ncbi:GNAT family N-acetyltransferase [Actinopolymorpha pittospori]
MVVDATRDDPAIRPFTPTYAGGISALARAEGWPTFSDPDRVLRLFTAPGALGVVAVCHEDVVGAAHLLTDGHHGYLTFLVVSADLRGRGIGRRLVAEVFETSGADRIDLLSSPEAAPFYRSLPYRDLLGFRIWPERMRDHPDPHTEQPSE